MHPRRFVGAWTERNLWGPCLLNGAIELISSFQQCSHFFLFEPICTAILLAACSIVHVIRIHAIYEKNRNILYGMGGLLALQVVVTAICCGFYRCKYPILCWESSLLVVLPKYARSTCQVTWWTDNIHLSCAETGLTLPPLLLLMVSNSTWERSTIPSSCHANIICNH